MFPSADLSTRTKAATERYLRELNYYRGAARLNYRMYWILQAATIALGALTPVLLLIEGLPRVLASLPAALAGIAAALNGRFNYREDYCRENHTANALLSEYTQFSARAGARYGIDKSDDEVLTAFAQRIALIVDGETSEWQKEFLKSRPKAI